MIELVQAFDRTPGCSRQSSHGLPARSPRSAANLNESGRAYASTPSSLNVGLAHRTRGLSSTTRVQSIAARQTGIVTTTKNENQT
jgi:hypothetical protein